MPTLAAPTRMTGSVGNSGFVVVVVVGLVVGLLISLGAAVV